MHLAIDHLPSQPAGQIVIIHKPEHSWNVWPFGDDSPYINHIIPVTSRREVTMIYPDIVE